MFYRPAPATLGAAGGPNAKKPKKSEGCCQRKPAEVEPRPVAIKPRTKKPDNFKQILKPITLSVRHRRAAYCPPSPPLPPPQPRAACQATIISWARSFCLSTTVDMDLLAVVHRSMTKMKVMQGVPKAEKGKDIPQLEVELNLPEIDLQLYRSMLFPACLRQPMFLQPLHTQAAG